MEKNKRFIEEIKKTHDEILKILELPSSVLRKSIKNWSIKEAIIHIISWREEELRIIKKALNEQNPEWNYFLKSQKDIDDWNKKEIEKRINKTKKELRKELEKLLKEWINFLKKINERDLKRKFQPPWEGETTIEECIKVEIEHTKEHLNKIKNVIKKSVPPDLSLRDIYKEIKEQEIKELKKMTVEESVKLTEMLLREVSKWKK